MKSPLHFYKWTVDVAGQRVEEIESPSPITRQEAEQAAQLIKQSYAALTDDFLVETIEL